MLLRRLAGRGVDCVEEDRLASRLGGDGVGVGSEETVIWIVGNCETAVEDSIASQV